MDACYGTAVQRGLYNALRYACSAVSRFALCFGSSSRGLDNTYVCGYSPQASLTSSRKLLSNRRAK